VATFADDLVPHIETGGDGIVAEPLGRERAIFARITS
jgi:hypothetical protein